MSEKPKIVLITNSTNNTDDLEIYTNIQDLELEIIPYLKDAVKEEFEDWQDKTTKARKMKRIY